MNHFYMDNLLKFRMIRDISIIIYPSSIEPSSAHSPSSPCNKNHLNVRSWSLLLNIPLDQWDTPVLLDSLSNKLLTHSVVPHEPSVHIW